MIGFADSSPERLTLGQGLEVNTFSGTASLSIPLRATPGRAGFGPALALAYANNAGNSTFGFGWSLSGMASIGIDTTESDPQYRGESDRYSLSGGKQLVPVLEEAAGGEWQPVSEVSAGFKVERYRAREELTYEKFEKWTETASGRIHWRAYGRNGTVSIFGRAADNSSRICDPAYPDRRTFQWLLEAQYDRKGNALECEYKREDGAGIDPARSFEGGRVRSGVGFAQRYLKRIRYGNSKPAAHDGTIPAGNTWHFELVFDYGEHDAAAPESTEAQVWPVRRDPFSTHRPGFELRTYRLCRRVLMFHRFDELGPDPSPIGATEFTQQEDEAGTTMTAATYRGFRSDLVTGTLETLTTPSLSAAYSQPEVTRSFETATAGENLPIGIDGFAYQWIDLRNEGLPGILHRQGQAWFYKENLGGGRFGPTELVEQVPASVSAAFQLADQDGDGQTDFSSIGGREAGGYTRDRSTGDWSGYQTLRKLPRIDLATARVQWADLNGDGYSDLLIDKQDAIVWYPSDGPDGFADPVEIARADRDSGGVPTLEASARLNTFFADMTGDGRPDMVRIDRGRVEYWPNLGGARFGQMVVMENAPALEDFGQLDPQRLRLIDLDGSGSASLIYIGRGTLRYWINRSGNSFAPEQRITGLPFIDDISSAQVLDFLGDGSRCLVWSSPLPAQRSQAIRYLRLSGPLPPRMLLEVSNGMGATSRFSYRSSGQDYLRDKRNGQPWRTRIPRHRMVVESLEGEDDATATRTVKRFKYRDGYFDTDSRRFAGFGQVDSYDTDLSRARGEATFEENSPPSLSRIWYHTGATGGFADRSADFYRGDAAAARLPEPAFTSASEITTEERIEGNRIVTGTVWRQEIYTIREDGTRSAHPMRTSEYAYRISRLQPTRSKKDAVFTLNQSEALNYEYDGDPSDPRISHELVSRTGANGNVEGRVSLAYPRRATALGILPAQTRLHGTLSEHVFRDFDLPDRYELGIETEARRYELNGLAPPAGEVFTREEALIQLAIAAVDRLEFHEAPDGALAQARLIEWQRHRFWNDARDAVLPAGEVGTIALLHHSEAATMPEAMVSQVYGGRVDSASLSGAAHLVSAQNYWWASQASFTYGPASRFCRLVEERTPSGQRQSYEFDPHHLLIVSITDALGNTVSAVPDYQVMASARVVDANGNVSETLYDPLGASTATALTGDQLGEDGQPHKVGAEPLSAYTPRSGVSFAAILADPAQFLQGASRFLFHDMTAFERGEGPARSVLLEREVHVHDGEGGAAVSNSPIRVSISYFDGLVRPVQRKVKAGSGLAVLHSVTGTVLTDTDGLPQQSEVAERWLVEGHDVHNNKGWIVRQHEPWFSDLAGFEDDPSVRSFGAATRNTYDSVGRLVRQDFANGSFSTSAYAPWQARASDPNDNVSGSQYEAARAALPADDAERDALEKALVHARTPSITEFDPLGREIVQREEEENGTERRSEIVRGAQGLPAAIIDARGITSFTYRYDMLGRNLKETSVDSGERWNLPDAQGRVISRWDGRGFSHELSFDTAGRHKITRTRGPSGFDAITEARIYGDDPLVAQASLRNARGRLVELRDEAGVMTIDRRNMDGQVLAKSRKFAAGPLAHKTALDWSNPAAVSLQAQAYRSTQRVDAIGRIVQRTVPDGTERFHSYAALGHLSAIELSTADGTLSRQVIASEIEANARGQHARILFGNGAETLYSHDPETFQLSGLLTRMSGAGGRVFQDIAYSYDPVGNITRYIDRAQAPDAATTLLRGAAVSPVNDFTYDAFYQLRRASGRVHQALIQHDYRSDLAAADAMKSTRHISLNNGAAIERYTRTYDYDLAGNFSRLRHQGASQNWTTDYWTSPNSNRSLPQNDLSGNPLPDPESHFDANGNTIKLPHLRAMDWNHSNQLTRAVVIDRSSSGQPDDAEYYQYGGDGVRVRKVTERLVAGAVETTETLYLDECEIRRIVRSDTVRLERMTSHVSDGARQLATLHQWTVDDNARETDDVGAKKLHYLVGNHLGSVSLELDPTGAVISYEEFFPFGGTSFIAGRSTREVRLKDVRYSGKPRDDMTGLYCYEFRYYAPFIGNWLSPDPLGPVDGLNLYRFVHNNPIRFVDPLGLETSPIESRVGTLTRREYDRLHDPNETASSLNADLGPRAAELSGSPGTFAWSSVDQEWYWDRTRPQPVSGSDQSSAGSGGEGANSEDETGEGSEEGNEDTGSGSGGTESAPGDGAGGEGEIDQNGTEGPGNGTEGEGPGAGERGDGDGGGGEESAVGTGTGNTGAGQGQGTSAGAGSTRGSGTRRRNGSGPSGTSTNGSRRRGGTGRSDRTDNGNGRTDSRGGGTATDGNEGPGNAVPPPGTPTEEGGIPYEEGMDLPEVTPEAGTPGGEAGASQAGSSNSSDGNGDARGVPGSERGSAERPGGVEGGSPRGQEGASQGGAPGGTEGGREGGEQGGREGGIHGGRGDWTLPSWLASPINAVIEVGDTILDVVQVGLDIVGLIPGVGEIADGISGLISLARGDYAGAALSFAAMIPFAGWAATAGKFGRTAVRGADAMSGAAQAVARHGDEVADAGAALARSGDEAAGLASRSADDLADGAARTSGGTATVHYRPNPDGTPHWTVETRVPGEPNLETHLVVELRGRRTSTYVETPDPGAFPKPPRRSIEVDVPDVPAARREQLDQIDFGNRGEFVRTGPNANSCATAVCEVISRGGGNFPTNPAEAPNFLRRLFNLPEI